MTTTSQDIAGLILQSMYPPPSYTCSKYSQFNQMQLALLSSHYKLLITPNPRICIHRPRLRVIYGFAINLNYWRPRMVCRSMEPTNRLQLLIMSKGHDKCLCVCMCIWQHFLVKLWDRTNGLLAGYCIRYNVNAGNAFY